MLRSVPRALPTRLPRVALLLVCSILAGCEDILPTLGPHTLREDQLGVYTLATLAGTRLPYLETTDNTQLEIIAGSFTLTSQPQGDGFACTFELTFKQSRRDSPLREGRETVVCGYTVLFGKMVLFQMGNGAVMTLRYEGNCSKNPRCGNVDIVRSTATFADGKGLTSVFRQ